MNEKLKSNEIISKISSNGEYHFSQHLSVEEKMKKIKICKNIAEDYTNKLMSVKHHDFFSVALDTEIFEDKIIQLREKMDLFREESVKFHNKTTNGYTCFKDYTRNLENAQETFFIIKGLNTIITLSNKLDGYFNFKDFVKSSNIICQMNEIFSKDVYRKICVMDKYYSSMISCRDHIELHVRDSLLDTFSNLKLESKYTLPKNEFIVLSNFNKIDAFLNQYFQLKLENFDNLLENDFLIISKLIISKQITSLTTNEIIQYNICQDVTVQIKELGFLQRITCIIIDTIQELCNENYNLFIPLLQFWENNSNIIYQHLIKIVDIIIDKHTNENYLSYPIEMEYPFILNIFSNFTNDLISVFNLKYFTVENLQKKFKNVQCCYLSKLMNLFFKPLNDFFNKGIPTQEMLDEHFSNCERLLNKINTFDLKQKANKLICKMLNMYIIDKAQNVLSYGNVSTVITRPQNYCTDLFKCTLYMQEYWFQRENNFLTNEKDLYESFKNCNMEIFNSFTTSLMKHFKNIFLTMVDNYSEFSQQGIILYVKELEMFLKKVVKQHLLLFPDCDTKSNGLINVLNESWLYYVVVLSHIYFENSKVTRQFSLDFEKIEKYFDQFFNICFTLTENYKYAVFMRNLILCQIELSSIKNFVSDFLRADQLSNNLDPYEFDKKRNLLLIFFITKYVKQEKCCDLPSVENFHGYENMKFYDGPDVALTDSTETFKILNKLEENMGQVCPKSLKALYEFRRTVAKTIHNKNYKITNYFVMDEKILKLNKVNSLNPTTEPFIIGICGGSASGKSTLTRNIENLLEESSSVSIISVDNFYHSLNKDQLKQAMKGLYNFDVPSAIDFDSCVKCVMDIKNGRNAQVPLYDFTVHQRKKETLTVLTNDVLILEGFLSFSDRRLLEMMDLKIFVETDCDIRLARRLVRDTEFRNRTTESVLYQWKRDVQPSYKLFIEPCRKEADLIVPGGGHNSVALSLLTSTIYMQLEKRRIFKSKSIKYRSIEDGHGPLPNQLIVLSNTADAKELYKYIKIKELQCFDELIYRFKDLLKHMIHYSIVFEPNVNFMSNQVDTNHFDKNNMVGIHVMHTNETITYKFTQISEKFTQGSIVMTQPVDHDDIKIHSHDIPLINENSKVIVLLAAICTGQSSAMAINFLLKLKVPEKNIYLISLHTKKTGNTQRNIYRTANLRLPLVTPEKIRKLHNSNSS
ncbi:hypothetical protein A3Q56_03519 [Intoshia linei]|uniref:uridine/cytidine kinase n=1 Tax=Intoshia linei TaxID=1819745 RepID=A0A177B3J9_9BILA|nr:hypothetical protein A3Q56_03519 [Intoshia linei]